jgi:hypothetical protein
MYLSVSFETEALLDYKVSTTNYQDGCGALMEHLMLQDIKKMSEEELNIAIKNCFDYAPEATPIDRLAVLEEAQFYTRELERRDDAFVSKRDLWLEIIVIGLITMELRPWPLGNIAIHTGCDASLLISLQRMGGHGNNRNVSTGPFFFLPNR